MIDLSPWRGRRNVIQSKDAGFGQRRKDAPFSLVGERGREEERKREEGREREGGRRKEPNAEQLIELIFLFSKTFSASV